MIWWSNICCCCFRILFLFCARSERSKGWDWVLILIMWLLMNVFYILYGVYCWMIFWGCVWYFDFLCMVEVIVWRCRAWRILLEVFLSLRIRWALWKVWWLKMLRCFLSLILWCVMYCLLYFLVRVIICKILLWRKLCASRIVLVETASRKRGSCLEACCYLWCW